METERRQQRQYFHATWSKRLNGGTLSALEEQLIKIISMHPEYHSILEDDNQLDKDYRTDNNPYLHMSLHMGLVEQLSTNRPQGIRKLYQQLCKQHQYEHTVQHMMMEVMGQVMWDAQQNRQLPDEQVYLQQLNALLT